MIPRRALIEENGQTFVQRVVGGGDTTTVQTERVTIETGIRTEDVVEVVSGLQEGDRVESRTLPVATPAPGAVP